MPFPPKADPIKFCENCGTQLARKRFGKRLEDRTRFLSRKNCGQACGNSKPVVTKDANHWRARHYRAASCSQCGSTTRLHVHHIDRDPANNDPVNLRTLCASCHLKLHWQQDRVKRLAAVRRGASTRRRSTAGS